jgi:hypothetical protein
MLKHISFFIITIESEEDFICHHIEMCLCAGDGALDNNEFSSEWAFYHNDYYSPFFNVADRNHNGRIEFVEGNQGFDHFDKNGKYPNTFLCRNVIYLF